MIPVRSHNSAKFSGVHLNDKRCGIISMAATTNSLPSTLKHRSAPHCTFSVAWELEAILPNRFNVHLLLPAQSSLAQVRNSGRSWPKSDTLILHVQEYQDPLQFRSAGH